MKPVNKILIAILSALMVLAFSFQAEAAYTTYTPITPVDINSHDDNDVVYAGREYTLTCSTSTDTDYNTSTCSTVNDPVVHIWSGLTRRRVQALCGPHRLQPVTLQ